MLVVSYNPGYQNLLKSLKPSTRQRFLSIEFGYPPADVEAEIVAAESGLDIERCRRLVDLGNRLRALKGQDLEEGCSTRLLVYCAALVHDGLKLGEAIEVALIEPLSDDGDVKQGLRDLLAARGA